MKNLFLCTLILLMSFTVLSTRGYTENDSQSQNQLIDPDAMDILMKMAVNISSFKKFK